MKYFVSYTVRDNQVTRDLLESFSLKLSQSGDVFVDIIDNDSEDKQERVLNELDESDMVILIESKSVYESEWVAKEIERAKSKQIPIKTVGIDEVLQLNAIEGSILKCLEATTEAERA